jgi:hypothetical protein
MFFRKCRLKFKTFSSLPIGLLLLAISACGGGGFDGGSGATNVVTATASSDGTYLVSWEPVADSRVTGYKLYYATTPLDAGVAHVLDVGGMTSYTFNAVAAGIAAGTTLYFAVTSVGSGMESVMSDPVNVVVQ